jgi:hypothetical protein
MRLRPLALRFTFHGDLSTSEGSDCTPLYRNHPLPGVTSGVGERHHILQGGRQALDFRL